MAILKKIYILLLILLPLLLSGCYQDFDPKIDVKPVLCLNSLITSGEPIEVRVSRTWVYTDEAGENDHSVKDATVSIYANGTLTDAGYLPAEGDRIRIHASSPTYGEAEAEVTVPFATEISGTDYTATATNANVRQPPAAGIGADIDFDIRITLDLRDRRETADFHRLTYKTFESDSGDGIWTETRGTFSLVLLEGNFEALDPIFYQQVDPFEDMMYGNYHTLFFSDRLYNGEEKPLTFGLSECRCYVNDWDGDSANLECGWDITLWSISESYYNWLAFDEQEGGVIFGDMSSFGLAEPIWGYSNVSTGAGVVAAQSSVTVRIDIKNFLIDTLQ